MADAPHHCGHSPRHEWSGALACHCSSCGLTFSGVTTFDEHQVGPRCLTIRQLKAKGIQEVRDGVLGRPNPTQGGVT
jgi:hypothetical protein